MTCYFHLISAFFLCLATPTLAWTGQNTRTLHIDLSYSGLAASYNLYKNGKLVCSSMDTGETQLHCSVEIDPTPMTFALTAVDANGEESPPSAPYILAPPAPPTANFAFTITSTATPATVSFDASDSVDFDGMIIGYQWDFGDGSNGTGKFIDHSYSAPGTYTTRLTVTDDDSHLTTTTSLITIEPFPETTGLPLTTQENAPIKGTLTAPNAPGTTQTFTITTLPQHGTITAFDAQSGTFTYIPFTNFNGTDYFEFTVNDGTVTSAPATVSLNITKTNHAPKANTDFVSVKNRRSIVIPVLANDGDQDGDPLSLISVTPPNSGISQIINGEICYTASNVAGLVTFGYQLSDGMGMTASGSIEVTVTP